MSGPEWIAPVMNRLALLMLLTWVISSQERVLGLVVLVAAAAAFVHEIRRAPPPAAR